MPEKISGHLPVAGILFRPFYRNRSERMHHGSQYFEIAANKINLKNL